MEQKSETKSINFYSVEELQQYSEQSTLTPTHYDTLNLTFTEKRVKDFDLFIKYLVDSKITFNNFTLSLDQPEDEDDEDHVEGEDPVFNIMQESKQEKVLNFLQNMKDLKRVSLFYDRNQVKKGGELYKKFLLNQGSNLEELELSFNDNFLTGFFAVPLLEGVQSLKKLKKLQLLFDENKIKSSEQFCGQIYKTLKSLTNIEHVQMSFCENQGFNGMSVDKILEGIQDNLQENNWKSIKHLEFHFDGASIKNIEIFQRLQKIVQLLQEQKVEEVVFSFEECKGLKEEHIKLLREIQNENRFYKISFEDNRQEWDDFYALKKEIQSSQENYQEILQNSNELMFEFPDQAIMLHDLKFLVEKFESAAKNLSVFDIDLTKNDVNEAFMKKLCEFLILAKKLKKMELNLANNEITDKISEESFNEQFFNTYKYLDVFSLDVFGNKKLTDLFFQNLSSQILKNHTLMGYLSEFKLILGDSEGISDKTCVNLAKLLQSLQKIEDLSLSLFKCPKITFTGIQKLLQCLFVDQAQGNLRNIEISFMELGLSSQDVINLVQQIEKMVGNIENIHLWEAEIDLSKNGDDKDYKDIKKIVKDVRTKFPMIKIIYRSEQEQKEKEAACKDKSCTHKHE